MDQARVEHGTRSSSSHLQAPVYSPYRVTCVRYSQNPTCLYKKRTPPSAISSQLQPSSQLSSYASGRHTPPHARPTHTGVAPPRGRSFSRPQLHGLYTAMPTRDGASLPATPALPSPCQPTQPANSRSPRTRPKSNSSQVTTTSHLLQTPDLCHLGRESFRRFSPPEFEIGGSR